MDTISFLSSQFRCVFVWVCMYVFMCVYFIYQAQPVSWLCINQFQQDLYVMQWNAWWGYQLTKTVQNGGPQAISEILHIEYRIVCCIETYLIRIYHMSKSRKCSWNRYIEGFCMWNVHFHINELSPNIAYAISLSWPLMAIYFLLLNYWLFSVQFSYHIKW